MDGKPAIASKTLWFNILSAIAAIGTVFGMDFGLTEAVQAQIIASANILGNFLLRLISATPISRII